MRRLARVSRSRSRSDATRARSVLEPESHETRSPMKRCEATRNVRNTSAISRRKPRVVIVIRCGALFDDDGNICEWRQMKNASLGYVVCGALLLCVVAPACGGSQKDGKTA